MQKGKTTNMEQKIVSTAYTPATAIAANHPYIIKVGAAGNHGVGENDHILRPSLMIGFLSLRNGCKQTAQQCGY